MPEGRIKWFNPQKRYGRIEFAQDREIFIHINQWQGSPGSWPQEGQRVTFHIGEFKGREEAQNVRPIGAEEPYRFLNPYNFVRYFEQPRPENHVLGDCPPPPHDRYVGLTGRITCTVEAKTPLFISDSHEIQEGQDDHKSYRFFQYDGKPALPASSLRGMVRSVFEAVTNSCYGVLGGERLDHRLEPGDALELVPARIERTENGWRLRLLTGTTKLRIGRAPSSKQYAAWIHRYWPIKPSGTLTRQRNVNHDTREFQARTRKGAEVNLDGLEHGQPCYALLEPRQHPHPRIKFWDVVEVSEDKESLLKKKRGKQRVECGWLCLNNQNIEVKHSERFFFRASESNHGPEFVTLSLEVVHRYEELVEGYQKRHKDEIQRRKKQHQPFNKPAEKDGEKELGLSRFIYQTKEREVHGGELVYAKLRGSNGSPQVEFIVPVSVPRVGFEYSIVALLKRQAEHLLHCAERSGLCPACRVFGWVYQKKDDEKEIPQDKITAYAGRVRFSHGKPIEETLDYKESISLAILSTPKPTTTEFYLLDSEGEPDFDVDYDDENAHLRGRKFYRHHGKASAQEYTRAPIDDPKKDNQNRTVRDALQPGATFTFTLDFENLAPVELGALLYTLELEEDLVHRLGYAKPLGFGSVKVTVDEVKTVNWREWLKSLDAGWQTIDGAQYKRKFIETMQALYGDEFDKVMDDLRALLGEHPDNLPVHYPRPSEEPDPDGKNYEWFQGNEERKQTLSLASNDTEGFPIWDKKGNEVK